MNGGNIYEEGNVENEEKKEERNDDEQRQKKDGKGIGGEGIDMKLAKGMQRKKTV